MVFWKIFLLLPRLMVKNAKKKKICEDKWFLSKKHQTFDFVSNDRYVFNAIFKNYIFRDI